MKCLAIHKYWSLTFMPLLMWQLEQDASVMDIQINVWTAQVNNHHEKTNISFYRTNSFLSKNVITNITNSQNLIQNSNIIPCETFIAGLNGERTWVCECKHFTDGQDCEKCLPFYNDAPWGRATSKNVHECKRKYNTDFDFDLFLFIYFNVYYWAIVYRLKSYIPMHSPGHRSMLHTKNARTCIWKSTNQIQTIHGQTRFVFMCIDSLKPEN